MAAVNTRKALRPLGLSAVAVAIALVGLGVLAEDEGRDDGGALNCGEYSRSLGMSFDPDPFTEGHACIVRASETGGAAVLTERWELTGGGTSRSEYRVVAPGHVILTAEVTGDDHMADGGTASRCEGLVMNQGLLEGTRCQAIDAP